MGLNGILGQEHLPVQTGWRTIFIDGRVSAPALFSDAIGWSIRIVRLASSVVYPEFCSALVRLHCRVIAAALQA